MFNEIKIIKDLCSKFPVEKKLLFVPSINMKGQILKCLNDYGINSFNLHVKTLGMLASEVIEEYMIKNHLIVLDENGQIDIVRDILINLKENNKLKYFEKLENTYGLNKVIASTLKEIKFGGYYQNKIDFSLIKEENKRLDIELLIEEYDKALKENKFIDSADVINLSLNLFEAQKFNYAGIVALEGCEFSYIEKLLLQKIGCDIAEDDNSKLLHYENYSKQLKNVNFKKCYGDVCEIKEVIRTIINNNIPFDEVSIIGLEAEPYTQLLYEDFCTYTHNNKEIGYLKELPITFGSGLPLSLSSPAKLLLLLLNWVRNGYTAHDFVSIFSSGTINISDEKNDKDDHSQDFGRMNIINAIKSSDLKWQRNTYLSTLTQYKDNLERKLSTQSDPANSIVRRLNAVKWLIDLLENVLFKNIPEIDELGKVDVDKLIMGLKNIVNQYVKIMSPIDTQGLVKVNAELNTIIKGRIVPFEEISTIITEHIRTVKIVLESPMPGKIHFSTYKGSEWINRKYIFIVGMDVGHFPCVAIQNPIILDEERGETMPKSYKVIENNICSMSRLLESLKENVTVSYSYFNTSEDRENYPSTIYNSLVENVAFNNGIEEYDFWRNNIQTVNIALEKSQDYIDETDCILSESIKEFEYTDKNDVIDDDYKIDTSKGIEFVDPRESNGMVSASSLKVYYDCPYRYYLQYVLGLKQLSDKELDKLGWLSFFEVGHLYHEIFERFENDIIKESNILENEVTAIGRIKEISEIKIKEYEESLPVASEYYTESQKQEIEQNIKKFAIEEVQNKDKSKPIALEYEFGIRKPCKIKLPSGKELLVTGFVDRIDVLEDNSIKIIDYKTGSTYGYEILDEQVGVLNSKSLQQILYFLALKEIGRNAENDMEKKFKKIKLAQYYFVTSKGDYEKFTIKFDENSEEIYLKALDELLDEISNNEFMPNINNCNYCPYNAACKNAGGNIYEN